MDEDGFSDDCCFNVLCSCNDCVDVVGFDISSSDCLTGGGGGDFGRDLFNALVVRIFIVYQEIYLRKGDASFVVVEILRITKKKLK